MSTVTTTLANARHLANRRSEAFHLDDNDRTKAIGIVRNRKGSERVNTTYNIVVNCDRCSQPATTTRNVRFPRSDSLQWDFVSVPLCQAHQL